MMHPTIVEGKMEWGAGAFACEQRYVFLLQFLDEKKVGAGGGLGVGEFPIGGRLSSSFFCP